MSAYSLRILALLFCCAFSVTAFAQIQKVSTEAFNARSQSVIVDQQSGSMLTNEFIGNSTNRIFRNGTAAGSITEDEKIVHLTSSSFYTQNKKSPEGFILKKYNLNNNIEENSLVYKKQTFLIFFENGAFLIVDSDESEGHEISFYSEKLEFIKKFTPFKDGFEYVQYTVYKNTVVLGIKALSSEEGIRLISFNSAADLLYNQQIPVKTRISNIASSKNATAVHWYNSENKENELLCYDLKGALRWTAAYSTPIDKLVIYDGGCVFTSGTGNLYLLNAQNGGVIEKKKLTDIYDELRITRTRSDNYVRLTDIRSFNDDESIGILLAEPTLSQAYTNIVLYTFKDTIGDKATQTFSIGESSTIPTIRSSSKGLLIIKDKEILKYEIRN